MPRGLVAVFQPPYFAATRLLYSTVLLTCPSMVTRFLFSLPTAQHVAENVQKISPNARAEAIGEWFDASSSPKEAVQEYTNIVHNVALRKFAHLGSLNLCVFLLMKFSKSAKEFVRRRALVSTLLRHSFVFACLYRVMAQAAFSMFPCRVSNSIRTQRRAIIERGLRADTQSNQMMARWMPSTLPAAG